MPKNKLNSNLLKKNDFPNTQQKPGEKTCGPICLINVYFGVDT